MFSFLKGNHIFNAEKMITIRILWLHLRCNNLFCSLFKNLKWLYLLETETCNRYLYMWVRGVVVKTYGYIAEGPGFDNDSVRWKFQYITSVICTLPLTSLEPRPKLKLEWVLYGPQLVKFVPCFDSEYIIIHIILWFIPLSTVACKYRSPTRPRSHYDLWKR